MRTARPWVASVVSLLTLAFTASCTTDSPVASSEIHLFGFNDLHGNLEPPAGSGGSIAGSPAGGAAYLAAHLTQLRARHPASAVLATGDNVSASPLVSSLFHDEPTIHFMNSIGVATSAVGNHEFDHGVRELTRLQQGGCAPDGCAPGQPFTGAKFPYLAANVTDRDGQLPPGLRPWTMITVGGHRVGVVGVVTTDTANIVMPEGIRGYTFGDPSTAINKNVPAMKAEGAETVIALIHDGGAQRVSPGTAADPNGCADITSPVRDFATRTDPAVSVLFTAHTHQAYVCQIGGKVIAQGASYGRLITDVTVRFTDGAVRASAKNHAVTRDIDPDPAARALVSFYADQAKPRAARVVGTITGTLSHTPAATGDSPLGNVVAESMLAAASAPQSGGAVAAVMNAGGVRADLVGRADGPSPVTFGQIHTVLPFDNQIVTVALTGSQLLRLLEQQWAGQSKESTVLSVAGIAYSYNDSAPAGAKVAADTVRIGGQPLNPVARYRIATNNFLASGGDGFSVFADGVDKVVGPADLPALEAYLSSHAPVAPPSARVTKK